MGTQYTDDGGLGDFIVGQSTGVGYNFHSSLGAQTRTEVYAPPSIVPPNSPNRGTAIGSTYPSSWREAPLTAEQKAELARRDSIRRLIKMNAPMLKRITRHVHTYLDCEGFLEVNSEGGVDQGDIVKTKEHFRRLEEFYRMFWTDMRELTQSGSSDDPRTRLLHQDAKQRLELLKRGRFLCPVDRNLIKFEHHLNKKKKTWLGIKAVPTKVWYVNVKEYDRRLRLFIDKAFNGSFANCRLRGNLLCCASAEDVFYYFVRRPSTRLF